MVEACGICKITFFPCEKFELGMPKCTSFSTLDAQSGGHTHQIQTTDVGFPIVNLPL